jgi:indolepyruvate ferredoxin oxidoreductase beta subunit
MFGALAASGVLPLPRTACESALTGGKAAAAGRAQASLRGFAAGWQAVVHPVASNAPADKRALGLAELVAYGEARLRDHQDEAYALQYRGLIDGFAVLDAPGRAATRMAARYLALWMAYEDVIRVADLKSRRSRFEQIRREYGAADHEPVVVRDFLKPGIDEIAAILPPGAAERLRAWGRRRGRSSVGQGVQLATSSVSGLLAMRLLARARFMRRRSSRFAEQQAWVARWSAAMTAALQAEAAADRPLACAVAELPRLIKGYGSTFERGHGHFTRILESLIEPGLRAGTEPARLTARIRQAFDAALAAPDGDAVFDALGLQRPVPKEQPIRFVKPQMRQRPS